MMAAWPLVDVLQPFEERWRDCNLVFLAPPSCGTSITRSWRGGGEEAGGGSSADCYCLY